MESAILHILHEAIEAHLPNITDENRRQTALTYLRGLDVALAIRSPDGRTSNAVALRNQDTKSRLNRVISDYRRSAIADTRRLHQRGFQEFGWDVQNEID